MDNALFKWASTHPRLAAWIVLSVGMVTLLVIEAQDVGLLARQWAALLVFTVLVAGLCIWIISWEDDSETPEEGAANTTAQAATEESAS